MKSLLILLGVTLLGATSEATYPGVISPQLQPLPIQPVPIQPIQSHQNSQLGAAANSLLGQWNQLNGNGQYNELTKEIISKHKQFRVTADERFQWEALDQINAKRSLHESTRPLKLGYNFANYTVDRAHSILRDIENKRDIAKGKLPLGESFFWYYDPNRYRSVDDAINTWYQEKRNYDYNRPGFSAKTGGFTQLIWKSTKEASCAKIDYETREHYKTLVVCNFYPAGNVNGEFGYNVLPPRRGGGGGGGRPPTRPEYPDDERPSRPGGGGGGRPPSRPEYPDDERPSRPGGGGGGRPPTRPDYPDNDRPNRPGGGGGGRPRPPYDEDDYDRPNRPGGGGGGGYPTRPISVTGSTETILYPTQQAAGAEVAPSIAEPQPQAVLVAQVDPASLSGATGAAQPTVYAAGGQLPLQIVQQQGQQEPIQGQSGPVYEPIEAILIMPQYANPQQQQPVMQP